MLARPFALAVSPDPNGAFVYAGDFTNAVEGGAIDVFSRDASTGQLARVQTLSHAASTVDGLDKVRWLAISPDGRSLYVSSQGDNTLGVFQRDAGTGMVASVQVLQHGVGGVAGLVDPWGLQVSADGAYLYVASHGTGLDGSVDVFARDADTGMLTALDSIAQADVGFENPDDVALSPDGLRVYVTAQGELGPYDGKLAVFSRDAGTGDLALLGVLTDGTDGVEGLKGALAVAASADGRSVYVASEQDVPAGSMQTEKGALAAFSTAPEPDATGVVALVTLAQLSASQSRGRRKTS
jgi:6-phosphogluconolactonase (cycloisomerase 2 family)